MLATDLDGTLVGDNNSKQVLLEQLQKLRAENKLKLVYSTGRSLERYEEYRESEGLPHPDAIIAAVGTEVYEGENYTFDETWSSTFSPGWDRTVIMGAIQKLPKLALQKPSEQRPYKLSLHGTHMDDNEIQAFVATINQIAPTAEVLVSHDGEYIDITPRGSDKGKAVQYLADKWGIDQASIICAGDSANDISMLAANKAIIVSNAYPELKQWAKGKSDVYVAAREYAAGISEGFTFYLGKDWNEQEI